MPMRTLTVGVFALLRPPATRWGTAMLVPSAVVWPAPDLPAPAAVGAQGGAALWHLGAHGLTLHSGDTGHMRDNLAGARPSVWVALAQAGDPASVAVRLVTVDPYEGGGLADDEALVVEATPLPPAIAAEMTAFIAAHHVEVPFEKRRRSPATAPGDPRAPRILRPEDKWGRG